MSLDYDIFDVFHHEELHRGTEFAAVKNNLRFAKRLLHSL